MSFAWPQLLWLLLVPALWLGWELTHRRRAAALARPKILRAEAGIRSLKLSDFAAAPSAHAQPRVWLCAGLALAVFALARPQWGRIEEPVFDQSREILLAIDLSRSMLTPDVKPSRLDRAKLLIQSLLEKLEGERVGLVVFAGTSFLQSPLSADYEILREFLPSLGPDFLPQGGSNYGALLDASLQAFSATASADRFLVILSDGEATDDTWRAKMEELKKKNIRVIGLGVGTAGGAMIPDRDGGFVKDERGAVVLSKLESDTLQELARATDGVYRDASAWVDVAGLVRETVEAGRKGDFVEKNTIRLVERFQWPLALGLWCLFVSFCYEFPVRPRPRDLKITPETGMRKPETGSAAARAAAAALALLCGLALLYPVSGFAAAKLANPAAAAAPAAEAEASSLAKIVGRLAAADAPTGRDWAELGRETVTWGSKLQSSQQPVPEGPVRDALKAARLGEKLDPKTADWPKLREELEALLKKEDQKNDQQQDKDQQQQQDQNQDQQNQDQQKQDQKKQQKNDQKKQDKSGKQDEQQDQDSKPENQDQPNDKPEDQPSKPGESAFGDMKSKEEPPPPPPENTQQVGGAPEKKQEEAKEQMDPALALPLQKLEQLRNQDSPAQLFQMMEGEKKPAKKTGKDW
jgi:Ca-activated chloride channel family protein